VHLLLLLAETRPNRLNFGRPLRGRSIKSKEQWFDRGRLWLLSSFASASVTVVAIVSDQMLVSVGDMLEKNLQPLGAG